MDFSQVPMILIIALGLGLLHALDADHIMAVTNLAAGQADFKSSLLFCFRWAIGHGLVLTFVGLAVFILGISLPKELSQYAELAVALILIIIGIYVLIDIYRKHVHIHFHQHDDKPIHAHWHSHKKQHSHQHSHTALFVGMLHGMAGSAPLLALIPIAMTEEPVYGFIYLAIFSLGVLIAMLIFGGLLGYFSKQVMQYSEKIFRWVRAGLGLGAISVGGLIFASTIS